MDLKSLECPCCGASIEADIQGRDSIFCNYCGKQFDIRNEHTTTKNINIKKDIKINKRYTNDADVIRAQTEAKKGKNDLITFAAIMGVFALMIALCLGVPAIIKAGNESAGNISAGYYQDLIGENYKTVEAHFRAAGFTNIELVDLNDSGLAFWKEGKVETISIGGNTSFESLDYFDPSTNVVISYH